MASYACRGVGPLVFISYSFKDQEVATRVASILTTAGCRVRMENEESLIGHQLGKTLPERIGAAEAVVQLRTAFSRISPWVEKEWQYARAPRPDFATPVAVMLALDAEALADGARYRDLVDGSAGLERALETVTARVLEAVRLLPLSEQDVFRFDEKAIECVLRAPLDRRRIIVDSDGKLPRWMDETLAHIESTSVPHKEKWLEEERRRQARSIACLADFDVQAAELIAHLARAYKACGCPLPGYADKPLNLFCLLRIGPEVLQCALQMPSDHPELGIALAGRLASLQNDVRDLQGAPLPFLRWMKGQAYPREPPSPQDCAAMQALDRIGLQDEAWEKFARSVRSDLGHLLTRQQIAP